MKRILPIAVFVFIGLLPTLIFAQGSTCSTASPFCTANGTATFPASQNTTAPSGPSYGCLYSQPNPAWFYLEVATAGNITLNMTNSANVDIDFVIWGPFTSASAACASGLPASSIVPTPFGSPGGCSYSSTANETGNIPNALVGEVYVLLITNYSNQATNISLAQTGGSGATNCNIICAIDSLNYEVGACVSPSNLFDLSGVVKYSAPPGAGTLTISTSCSSATQVFNAPFNPDSVSFTLAGLPANGTACTVTAEFSNDPNCTLTKNFTAPPPCFVNCPVIVDSAHTCDGVATLLTASGSDSYLWSTGQTTPSILVSGVPASYTVIGITGTCADTATTFVTTFPPPTAHFTADILSGCGEIEVNFLADTTGNSGANYTWNFGDGSTGTGTEATHLFDSDGCYTIQMTASFGPGCSTKDSVHCMIEVYPLPHAAFSYSPEDLDIIAPTAYFSNTSTNSTSWLWDFGDTTTSTLQSPEHDYQNVGFYTVNLHIADANGCTDSTTSAIQIKDIITCYVPSAFTPNQKGGNEEFNMFSYGVSPSGYEMLIFDRWGRLVFKTNDLKEGWNGSFNNKGTVLPSDTYVYRITYKELTGKQKILTGTIELIK